VRLPEGGRHRRNSRCVQPSTHLGGPPGRCPQSVASELLEAFRAGEGGDLIRESVRSVLQEVIELEAAARIGAGRYERTDAMRDREVDPKAIMREWGVLTTEVASVVSPIRLLMRSAALADPEMEGLLRETDEDRLSRMGHHARFLKERGYLREGVTLREATDVLWTCSSVEIYDLLVLQRGWTLPRFAKFVTDFMVTALLPPE
jgi:hypothetical protein